MGLQKRLWEEQQNRGYGSSDLCVCQYCFGDEYLKKHILTNGETGKCSFCKDKNGKPARRKVLPLEELMEPIMKAIRTYYLPADENAIWDPEEKEYLNTVEDAFDLIYTLDQYMQCADSAQLEAITSIVNDDLFVDVHQIEETPEERDLSYWFEFCNLVNARKDLSAEQIVSLCTRSDSPSDLRQIYRCLDMVLSYAKEMHMYEQIHTYTPIYRCVNRTTPPRDFNTTPATLIGTAPAKFVANNRMSEQGDMMFYGATDIRTALREVYGDGEVTACTVGKFFGNKRISVLNLSSIANWQCPSIFDIENRDKRSIWLFLNEFIKHISRPLSSNDEYKPTQVLTKYIQRKTNLKGIAYRSSKTPENEKSSMFSNRCYVLFVTNRDCLDQCDKVDTAHYQLIMEPNPVVLDSTCVAQRIGR